MKKALFVVLVVVVSAVSAGTVGGGVAMALVRAANPTPGQREPGPSLNVISQSLGEALDLEVRLPLDYDDDPTRGFPVLWLTDDRGHLDHAAHTVQVLATLGEGEPMIIVAVPSSSPGRAYDFVPQGMGERGGGAADFLAFLVEEARPAVEAAYRTDGRNVLFGHSLGGLFVTWAMTERPSAFDGWLASSPSFWVGNGAIAQPLEDFLAAPAPASTYHTSLGADENFEMRRYFDEVGSQIEASAPSGWRWTRELTPHADHGSNPRLSLPSALSSWWRTANIDASTPPTPDSLPESTP